MQLTRITPALATSGHKHTLDVALFQIAGKTGFGDPIYHTKGGIAVDALGTGTRLHPYGHQIPQAATVTLAKGPCPKVLDTWATSKSKKPVRPSTAIPAAL